MANTTNYNWETPDDTDLVKDGAAAIRTLGSAIDTTTKNLNPSTTLGDIEYRSSTANTNTRLPIGTSGQVLTVSAGVPAWTTISGGGWTEITSGSFPTGASTLTISAIPTTYKFIKFILRDVSFAADGNFRARLNADNSGLYQAINSFSGTTSSAGDASINMIDIDVSAADGVLIFDLPNYADSGNWKLWRFQAFNAATDGSNYISKIGFGSYRSNNQITSIQFYDNSNNNYSSGIYTVLGGN